MAEPNTAEVEATVDAAFGAAFGGTPPAPVEKVVEDAPVEPAKPVAAAVPAVVPEKPRYVRLTEQDWNNTKAAAGKVASLESQVAKLMGSMPKGDQLVQQVLESVRSQTPAGLNVEISEEDFADLAADFPELAKHTRSSLEKIFKKANVRGTGPAQPPAPAVDIDAAVEKVLLSREADALAKAYPDWSDIVGRPPAEGAPIPEDNAFRAWLATQPADYQQEIRQTKSPAEVKAAIDKFKATPRTTTPATPDRAAARRAVIEDAVTPRAEGNPPPLNSPQSAEEAFGKGFKAVKAH